MYKEFTPELNVLKYDAMSKARLNTTVFNYVYGILFEKPAIIQVFDDVNEKSFDNMPADEYKQKAKDDDVKDKIKEMLIDILKFESRKIQLYISTAQLVTYALVKDSRLSINADKLVLGIKVSKLIDFKAMVEERQSGGVQETVKQEVKKRSKDTNKALDDLIKDRNTAYEKRVTQIKAGKDAWAVNPYSRENEYYSRTIDGWNMFKDVKSSKTSERQSRIATAYNSRANSRAESRAESSAASGNTSDNEAPDENAPLSQEAFIRAFYKETEDLAGSYNSAINQIVEEYLMSVPEKDRNLITAQSKELDQEVRSAITHATDVISDVYQTQFYAKMSTKLKDELRSRTIAMLLTYDIPIDDADTTNAVMQYLLRNPDLTVEYINDNQKEVGKAFAKELFGEKGKQLTAPK